MRRKPLLALAAASAVMVPAAIVTSSASAAVTQSTSKYFLKGGTTPIKGVKVSGYDGKSVYVAVTTNQGGAGTVSVGNTSGVSLPFGYSSFSNSAIAFTGTQDAVNAALQSLQATVPASATELSVKVTAFANQEGLAYNPANAHFYRFVVGRISATAASAAAQSTVEMGLPGYLASITSGDENDFVATKLQGADGTVAKNVWIGATDAGVEGDWIWSGGPDNGKIFWKGDASGSVQNGLFAAWAPEEPNNYANGSPYDTGENCAIINKLSTGTGAVFYQRLWNDLPCNFGAARPSDNISGYLAECGNKTEGGDYANVDIVNSNLTVAVPAAKPTFLDRLFGLVKFNRKALPKSFKITIFKPKTKKKPATTQTCPGGVGQGKMRFSYTLLFKEAGRYSFYFTNSNGKRIPMECGTKIKTRIITEPISAPVIQSVKDGERPVITAYLKRSSVGTVMDYPMLNVILKRPDGTLERQDQPNPPLPGTPIR